MFDKYILSINKLNNKKLNDIYKLAQKVVMLESVITHFLYYLFDNNLLYALGSYISLKHFGLTSFLLLLLFLTNLRSNKL